jgi:hypothetical protein
MNPDAIIDATQAVAQRLKADVVLFNQPIDPQVADRFHALLEATSSKHESAFVIFVTFGGDAHAAYVIARDLQLRYKKVILCIAGDCYSAGTLLVFCAHEVVISDRGRLGPLDVQIIKRDELAERSSGLTVSIALQELQRESFETFMGFTGNLKDAFGIQLSLKTAMDVAVTLTSGVFQEVYRQIDPIKLAEDARSLQIAGHYGGILAKRSGNLRQGAIDRLLKHYPSHECIIDRTEAAELFNNVRAPEEDEQELLKVLGRVATNATMSPNEKYMLVLSDAKKKGEADESKNKSENKGKLLERKPK